MQVNIEKVEQLRRKARLSKSELALAIGYKHPSGYSNLLKYGHVPRKRIIAKLSDILGVSDKSLLI